MTNFNCIFYIFQKKSRDTASGFLFFMTAETAADGTADALDFHSDTTPAVHRRVVYAYFSGIKFIEPAIFAFRNIGHNHIGTALQSHQPATRVQTFHCRGGRNVNVRHQDTHHRHSAQSQIKRTAGGIGKRRFRMGNERSDTSHVDFQILQKKQSSAIDSIVCPGSPTIIPDPSS